MRTIALIVVTASVPALAQTAQQWTPQYQAQAQVNDQPIPPPPPAYQPPSAQYGQQPVYVPPAPAYQPQQPYQPAPTYQQPYVGQQPAYVPPPAYQPPPVYGQPAQDQAPVTRAPAAAIAPPETPAQKANWYLPMEADHELAWNSHNPWNNDSMNAYLLQGFDSFVWSMTSGATKSLGPYWTNLWLETGVGFRFKGGFGLDFGAVTAPGTAENPSAGGALFFGGIEAGGQAGFLLHDWSTADVQVGILFPDFFLRVIAPPTGGNAMGELGCSGLTGVRVTIEDIVQIELRVPSLVVVGTEVKYDLTSGDRILAALQVGGRLTAGVVF